MVEELYENAEEYEDHLFCNRTVYVAKTKKAAERLCFRQRDETIKHIILSDRNEDDEAYKHTFEKEANAEHFGVECEKRKTVCSLHVQHRWRDETGNYWWRVLEYNLES